MMELTDIELQNFFAFSDLVCARNLLKEQLDILELYDTIIPDSDNLLGSTILIPFKYLKLLNSLIKCFYPNLGINFKELKELPIAEHLPLMEPIILNLFDTQLSQQNNDTITLIDIHKELQNLCLDSKEQCERSLSSSSSNNDKLITSLIKINETLIIVSEQFQQVNLKNHALSELD